jgi:hypothetical protein
MSTYSIAHGASADHRSEMHLFNPYKFCFSSLLLAMNVQGVALKFYKFRISRFVAIDSI